MDEGKLFSDIKFIIAQCNNADDVKVILIEGGAKHINYLSEHVTLVISDTNCPEAEEAVDLFDKPVVSSLWVHLSLRAKKLLPTEAFSPMKSIFHNVIASFSSDLSSNDIDILASTMTFYGAKVSKDVDCSTHFIVGTADFNHLSDKFSPNHQFKIVAPDWVLESVRLNRHCDEKLFDHNLLLPPPPPPPTPLPPPPQSRVALETLKQETDNKSQIQSNVSESNEHKTKIENSQKLQPQPQLQAQPQPQALSQLQSQPSHALQQLQTLPPSQLPRARMPLNIIRGVQPKFRPLLPPNNVPIAQRPPVQQHRVMPPDSQQPKKVTINYGQYRKPAPYQNNIDPQQQTQIQQPPYTQPPPQHVPIQQSTGNIVQPSRLPQPNMYQQVRGPYQNSHIPPRGAAQQPIINQQQQQPTQIINRFQDPNTHLNQRPYQVCLQPQTVNSNYLTTNVHRQPVYYSQGSNQMQMRMPQQGSPMRHMQNEQVVYDNFNTTHHAQESITAHPQHYQGHPPQQTFPHTQQQTQSQQLQQPPVMQIRPQFQSNFPVSGPSVPHVRTARNLFNNPQESKTTTIRLSNPPQLVGHGKGSRMPNNSQPQPHPSIFDHTQESNLSQIKAKVPIVTENIDYFGHDPKENIPKDFPLIGCKFKFIDYEEINPKLKEKWFDAIKVAGGSFDANLEAVSHLICENRLSSQYTEAIKLGIRCVTIYWINDVLAINRLSYPWKALHLPVPFSKNNKPLTDQIISITNFKGKERREVKEMILKTDARYTDYFSATNTLIICGNVGGEKYERAVEWKIPIANCLILSDILLNDNRDLNFMLTQSKYQLFNRNDPLKLISYSEVRQLMNPWTKPIIIMDRKDSDKQCLFNGAKNLLDKLNSNDDSGIATGRTNNNDAFATNGKLVSIGESTNVNGQLAVDNAKENHPCNHKETAAVESVSVDGKVVDKGYNDLENLDNQLVVSKISDSPANVDTNVYKFTENIAPDSMIVVNSIEDKKNVVYRNQIDVEGDGLKVSSQNTSDVDSLHLGARSARKSNEPVRLIFTHLNVSLVEQLESHATKLGLGLASSPTNCTHLIVDRISRTPKFICAFSHAKYILSYKWIVESHEANNLLDEKHFILQDKSGEEKYSFSLVYSLLKRRKRAGLLFNNLIFFVTPSVMSDVLNMKEMIESAGGFVAVKKPPTKLQVNQMKAEGKRFVMVTCTKDFHLCSTFESYGIDIVNVEFVLSGILRQDIDFEAHRLKKPRSSFIRPETTSIAQISQSSPPKKLRLEDSSC